MAWTQLGIDNLLVEIFFQNNSTIDFDEMFYFSKQYKHFKQRWRQIDSQFPTL